MVEATDELAKFKRIEADFVELERLDRLKNRGSLTSEDYDLWITYYISVLRLFEVEYTYALQERRTMRLPVGISVAFTHDGESCEATTVDLSVGGMAIPHQDGFDVGQEVMFKLNLGELVPTVELKAIVRRTSVTWDRIGFEFMDMSTGLLDSLESGIYGFVREKIQSAL